uniref:Uncharacterized protein n=1 Tax=Rhizophora mucronata TaxID=61149 RepID=A0A2P2Q5W2_RHIMU
MDNLYKWKSYFHVLISFKIRILHCQ